MKKAIWAILFCFVSNAEAQHSELIQSAEEVFWGELVFPQEQRELQVTLSPWINTSIAIGQTPLIVEYGLSDAWQIEAEWSGPSYDNVAESSILAFGTKYSFLNLFDAGVHAAIGSEIEIPISGEGIASEPFIVLAKDFPRFANLHLFSQASMEVEIAEAGGSLEEGAPGWSWHTGVLLPGERLHFSTELSWMHEDGVQTYVTPGAIWELINGFQIGVGVPIGLSNDADRFRISTFFTYEFEF